MTKVQKNVKKSELLYTEFGNVNDAAAWEVWKFLKKLIVLPHGQIYTQGNSKHKIFTYKCVHKCLQHHKTQFMKCENNPNFEQVTIK